MTTAREINRTHVLIDDGRIAMDAIDAKIIELLEERHQVSEAIREVKQTLGIPVTDLQREVQVIDRYQQSLGTDGRYIAKEILAFSKH